MSDSVVIFIVAWEKGEGGIGYDGDSMPKRLLIFYESNKIGPLVRACGETSDIMDLNIRHSGFHILFSPKALNSKSTLTWETILDRIRLPCRRGRDSDIKRSKSDEFVRSACHGAKRV